MWGLFKCVHCRQQHTRGGDGVENASEESGGDNDGKIAEMGHKCKKPKKHGKDGTLDGSKERYMSAHMDEFEGSEYSTLID